MAYIHHSRKPITQPNTYLHLHTHGVQKITFAFFIVIGIHVKHDIIRFHEKIKTELTKKNLEK